MTTIVWTEQALEDAEAIRDFIGRDSPRYADLTIERIVLSLERLRQFSESGRVVPELGDPSVREVITGNYRAVYRIVGETVQILTVFHGARLFPELDA